jgi:hypothetical protein
VVEAVTLDVVAVNVALVAPAATVTLAGTAATTVLLLESDTTAPPESAALERVTVPVEFDPAVTLGGFRLTACKLAGAETGVTVSVVVTDAFAVTDDVVTANVALVAPAAIMTLAGTAATAVLLLESETTAPPLGAAAVSVAVPVDALPPTTLDGFTANASNVAGLDAGDTISEVAAQVPL